MLNKGVDEVLFKDGVAWGIQTGNEVQQIIFNIASLSSFLVHYLSQYFSKSLSYFSNFISVV